MTLANKITLLRILLIPVFIITLLQGLYPWPAVIFTLIITGDALDGIAARTRKEKTTLGSFLDPLADKTLMFAAYVTLAYLKVIPLWILVIILSRDALIVAGWIIIYLITDSREVKPRLLGKMTTFVQMVTVWLVLLGLPMTITDKLLILTVVFTVLSGLDYLYHTSRILNHET